MKFKAIFVLFAFVLLNANDFEEAKKICDAQIQKDKPNIELINKNCLITAKGLWNQNNYIGALSYYKKILPLAEKQFGNESQGIATLYNDIGRLYYDKGDYKKALVYYKKAEYKRKSSWWKAS